jgi:transposase
MARVATFSKDEIVKAIELRNRANTVEEIQRALSVLLMVEGRMEADKAASLLGISKRTLFRYRESFRRQDLLSRSTWGGRRHCLMSPEEEQAFLSPWLEKTREGGVITVPPLHAALEEKLGRKLPPSTTYRLLSRHGWWKVSPDTKHPKSQPEEQEEFKKASRNSGSRPLDPNGCLSDPSSLSGRGTVWSNDRSPRLLGSRSTSPCGTASLGAGNRLRI